MERQSERKNNRSKAVIIIVAMLLMIALVVGMGAMTYSRYITSGTTGSQTATAAKWGFVVNVKAENLLGKNYTKGTGNLATIVESNGVAVKASAGATDNIVAPGTTGSMDIEITGTAEVLSQLSINISEDATDISCGSYKPIVWSLKRGEEKVFENVLMGDLSTELGDVKEQVKPGESYATNYTLSWSWPLENGKDVEDTAIGFYSQGKSFTEISSFIPGIEQDTYDCISKDLKFTITVSVEQAQTEATA